MVHVLVMWCMPTTLGAYNLILHGLPQAINIWLAGGPSQQLHLLSGRNGTGGI